MLHCVCCLSPPPVGGLDIVGVGGRFAPGSIPGQRWAQAAVPQHSGSTVPNSKVEHPHPVVTRQAPTMRAPISVEEELKRTLAAEREKRAAAAERRIATMRASATETTAAAAAATASSTSTTNSQSSGGSAGSGDLCSCCQASLSGKVPFHRYHYKYCSTSCMHVHREMLEDGRVRRVLNATTLVVAFLLPLLSSRRLHARHASCVGRPADVRLVKATAAYVAFRLRRTLAEQSFHKLCSTKGELLRGFFERFKVQEVGGACSRREDVMWSGGNAKGSSVFAFFAKAGCSTFIHAVDCLLVRLLL
ncbi:hypothetical protein Taro_024705 [Colocasia esculenta]|uniref:Vms1-associating treble clef domain-containing protein n=1 Tax=Colocasia esculenta TaxID=4460 RepID=A0A843V7H4_COLES|nr:hypothetical protein [Colocasia esculenta]